MRNMVRAQRCAEQSSTGSKNRSWLVEVGWIAAALSAVFVLALPTAGILGRLLAAAILLAIVIGLLVNDRRPLGARRLGASPERRDSFSGDVPDSASDALPSPAPWSVRPSHRGTFNPDDGLDSMISPLGLPDDSTDA
jgi:hypothetical protein